jgi:hypothetical protein
VLPYYVWARAVIFVWKHGDYALVGWAGWTRGEKHEIGQDDVRRDGMGECDITDTVADCLCLSMWGRGRFPLNFIF